MADRNRSRRNGGNGDVVFISENTRPKSDKSPPYNGSATVDGVDYWAGAWVKENKYGPYFHISLTKKDEQGGGQRSGGGNRDYNDDRPRRDDRQDDREPGSDDDRGSRNYNGAVPF